MSGHLANSCFKMHDASRQAKEEVKEKQAKRNLGKLKGKKTKAHSAVEEADTSQEAEFARNASSLDYTNPYLPLIPDAGADWNTNTGATCHMTSHRYWFNIYKPHVTPIRLANN